jgi:hypothetical protein
MSKNKYQAAAPAAEPSRLTEARVLIDVTVGGELYLSGSLLTADADVIASLGDQVDAHPDAVAYCKGLNNG